jgi:hypothetical protein
MDNEENMENVRYATNDDTPFHSLFIIYFNAPFLIFVTADRFQKP